MQTVPNDVLLQQLQWRYATKKFDPAKKISPQDWKTLEQALILSPSSFGLQPWRFFVVTEPDLRQQLRHFAWNQSQIVDASHLVVFAIKKNLGVDDVDRLIARTAEVRGVTTDSLEGYRYAVMSSVQRPPEAIDAWNAKQVYLALGMFMTAAALLGIDTCPMEGFEPSKFDEMLGLDKQGYAAVVLCPVGYRSPDDKYAGASKVRYKTDDVIVSIT